MSIASHNANQHLTWTVDSRPIIILALRQRTYGHFVTMSQHALPLPRSVGPNTILPAGA
jgi:hypothetical protein